MRASISFILVSALTLVACRGEEAGELVDARDARVVTDVVARVGQRPIASTEVAARMVAEKVDAKAALDALIDEELLVQEAERRGISENRAQVRAVERVMVRAMLHDLERDLTPESVPDEEVRADFESQEKALQIPERRVSWHILVKDSSEAGRALAESIHAEVQGADEPRDVFKRYAEERNVETAFEIVAEELPPIAPRMGFEKPYKDALFAARSTGPLDSLVESSYGWHVIVLTEILPAESKTLREVEDEIRTRLSQKKRFARLAELVRAREADGLVDYDEEGVQLLLAMPGLPERSQ